jgi:hypothetical protein
MKGISMNGTVRVDLIDRWLRHLYKNLGLHVRYQNDINTAKGVKSGRYEQKFITIKTRVPKIPKFLHKLHDIIMHTFSIQR